MTIKELKEAIKDMPDDAELWTTYDGIDKLDRGEE